MRILWDIAEVRAYGNKKYGDTESWRRVAIKRYVDALLRHTAAFTDNWWSVDKESGIRHWKHMACNMAFLSELLHEVEEAMDEL
jgi:hypothetical protein